jgi:SAM-dependent methyltransferase
MSEILNQISKCRICDSSNIVKFLSLGIQPWCDNFLKESDLSKSEPEYPLELFFCNHCTLVQLGYTVPKETMFIDYVYLSGTTRSLEEHFKLTAKHIVDKFNLNSADLVLDIGSNDGTFLDKFKNLGVKVLGVDPGKKQTELATKKGIETVNDFFNEDVAERILKKFGKTSIISAAGVFFHLEELHSVVKGIKKLLTDKGVFVIQATYLPSMIEKNAFDIVYHEHLVFYTLKTLQNLLSKYNLEIFDVDEISIHGGSIVVYASHPNQYPITSKVNDLLNYEEKNGFYKLEKYQEFSKRVEQVKNELLKIISELKQKNKIIYGYGAPAKGNTMLNYCGIDSKSVDLLVETNNLKCGLYAPGSKIKILHENDINQIPDYYLILPWNFLESFLDKEKQFLKDGGKFIVPIPKPKIMDYSDIP